MTTEELDPDHATVVYVRVEETTVYALDSNALIEVAKQNDTEDDLSGAAWVFISQGEVLDSKIRQADIPAMNQ